MSKYIQNCTVTFSPTAVTDKEEVHCLHKKREYSYEHEIPQHAQADWDQKDRNKPDFIKNKPFYSTKRVITWNGQTDGLEQVTIGGDVIYKVADILPTDTVDSILTNTRVVYSDGTIDENDPPMTVITDDELVVNEVIVITLVDDVDIAAMGVIPKPGVYFLKKQNRYASILEFGETVTIDPKYLPPTSITLYVDNHSKLYYDAEYTNGVTGKELKQLFYSKLIVVEASDCASVSVIYQDYTMHSSIAAGATLTVYYSSTNYYSVDYMAGLS